MKDLLYDLRDWLQLPLTLMSVASISDEQALRFAKGFSQGFPKRRKNRPYIIAINAFRRKHRRWLSKQSPCRANWRVEDNGAGLYRITCRKCQVRVESGCTPKCQL